MKVFIWYEPLASPHEMIAIVAKNKKDAEIEFKKYYLEEGEEPDYELDYFSKNPDIVIDNFTKSALYSI